MNRILAICHSLSPEGLNGVNVFLRSLVQTFTMTRFASIPFVSDLKCAYSSLPEQLDIWFKAFHKAVEFCGTASDQRKLPLKKETSSDRCAAWPNPQSEWLPISTFQPSLMQRPRECYLLNCVSNNRW
jgi:hypothetical protein